MLYFFWVITNRKLVHQMLLVILIQNNSKLAGGKIEKNAMGGACGAYGGGVRCAQGSGGETRRKENTGETQT
jgi:hypothetical protein